jgi:hypothetical protein
MNSQRKNAIWAGIFYIMATVAPIVTIFFIGFLGGGVTGQEPIPDYLAHIAAHECQVIIGMFVELTWALAVVGIIVTLFPILRKQHEVLALGFSSLRFIEAISTIVHAVILLSLLTLSREYAAAGVPDASYYHTAGTVLLAAREWTFWIGSGIVWSLSALILNYILYQSKLIPRWLSVWGLVGAALSLGNYVPQFFGINSIEMLFLPIGVQEMVFAVWLIVKGVSSSARISPSATQIETG